MNPPAIHQLVADLLIVLAAGFASGVLCKRLRISLLVGYLVVGAIIGEGGIGLVSQQSHELDYLARAGALLLLFSVGIEFSLDELRRMSYYFLLGGSTQMLLVAIPLMGIGLLSGVSWNVAILVSTAAALSSTVLVFKALAEWGQAATAHGRRAIGILLFQDVALVPLMLLVPLLTGQGDAPTWGALATLAAKSLLFIVAVIGLRYAISHVLIPFMADMRSVELLVLFSLSTLGASCYGAYRLDLPPAIGALAAGLLLSGNRISQQIDTVVLPFRETFAAVFFVTLGTLLQPVVFLKEPWLLTAALVGTLALKSAAACIALRLTGLSWRSALGMGLGLAQLGEFSFLLIAEGFSEGVVRSEDYNRVLFIALGTLIVTPLLLKFGLRWTDGAQAFSVEQKAASTSDRAIERALVIGMGPAGRQITSRLETGGVDVGVIDLSPINVHQFSQQGFHAIAGDARDPEILQRAKLSERHLVVVCVADDRIARQIVLTLRATNRELVILVRCRYQANLSVIQNAGADTVISEEQEAAGALLRSCESLLRRG